MQIFSALFSMLPESKQYLKKDGWDEQKAGLVMMGCFIGGFIGIQVISRLMHQILPSHVVDCDHSHSHDHDDTLDDPKLTDSHSHRGGRQHSRVGRPKSRTTSSGRRITTVLEVHQPTGHAHHHHHHATESTPLLDSQPNGRSHSEESSGLGALERRLSRRPSILAMRDRLVSFVKDTPKHACDADGSCFGYSDPCGQECFKHVNQRVSLARQSSFTGLARVRTSPFTPTAPVFQGAIPEVNSEDDSGTRSPMSPAPVPSQVSHTQSRDRHPHEHEREREREHDHEHHHGHEFEYERQHQHQHEHQHENASLPSNEMSEEGSESDLEAQDAGAHHHHVPENAFLAIGFQTVIAIALHKFPEGFITYATNHANPQLGFNVFMALFVHNIAEGFAMALPLYMAIGSRLKAIAVSSVLGGLTQPLGAGIGWLVIKWFGSSGDDGGGEEVGVDFTAYAVLFAATAGIMASVALQLFVESLSLNHNRNLSMTFAFLGMVLLGVSNAIAGHSH